MKKQVVQGVCALIGVGLLFWGSKTMDRPVEKEKRERSNSNKNLELQWNLEQIEPLAYGNVEGLSLEKRAYISIIGKGKDASFWKGVERGAHQAGLDLNQSLGYKGKDRIKVTFNGTDTENSVNEQINILDEELARYPIGLGIAIADVQACQVQFDMAAENDIPIVAFDSGSSYQGLMSMISTDNQEVGREVAERMIAQLKGEGEVLVFSSDNRGEAILSRERGFWNRIMEEPTPLQGKTYHLNQIEEMKKSLLLDVQEGRYENPISGIEIEGLKAEMLTEDMVMDYIFTLHPQVKGMFLLDGNVSQMVLSRLSKKNAVVVFGFDATEYHLKQLEKGELDGVVAQNPFGMGYATVVAVARSYLEMGNEAFVNTGHRWISKEEVRKKGWKAFSY